MVEAAQEERGGNTLSRLVCQDYRVLDAPIGYGAADVHLTIGLPALAGVARHDLIGSSAVAGVAWKDFIATAHVTAIRVIVVTTHAMMIDDCNGYRSWWRS